MSAASPVSGFPDCLRVGPVTVYQTAGPIRTQQTYVTQLPGDRLVFHKTMHNHDVGRGRFVTVALRPSRVPPDILEAMDVWSRECQAALGIVASYLDERVASGPLVEDLVIFDEAGEKEIALLDRTGNVRNFPPDWSVEPDDLAPLRDVPLAETSLWARSARWYLKGVQEGPSADGVLFLCTALDALIQPAGKGKAAFNVKRIEASMEAVGMDPTKLGMSAGRIANLRAQIVHQGDETPEALKDGYYCLELMIRLLIRQQLSRSLDSKKGWPPDLHGAFPTNEALAREPRWLMSQMIDGLTPTSAVEGRPPE